jgi:PKD repeat protein
VRSPRRHGLLHAGLFATLLAVVVAAVGAAGAGAKPNGNGDAAGKGGGTRPLIVAPRVGQRIRGDNLRLIVRSGPERDDLRAKLNGVAIGDDFGVNLKRHRRYLQASLVDGLRRGKNRLVVWVKRRAGGYRRATVDFVIAHRRPMASAGRDIRVAAGARSELHGLVARAKGAKGRLKVRWTLRSAPARSALQADLAPIGKARATSAGAGAGDSGAARASSAEPGAGNAGTAQGSAGEPGTSDAGAAQASAAEPTAGDRGAAQGSAVEPGAEPATIEPESSEAAEIEPAPPAFEEAATLSPVFAPDVPGRYTVQMTASSAAGTSTDEATIYVVPSTPMIMLQTETAGETMGSSRPGIQIGTNFLPAPHLRTAGGTANYSGSINGIQYKAIFQIVALERSTTALKWNRTYGICQNSSGGGSYPCRVGEPGSVGEAQVGVPVPAKPSEELSAAKLGVETLLIATSHVGGGSGMEWAAPDEAKFVDNELGVIGFPGSNDKTIGSRVAAAKAGEMAGVGVPGLEPGQATITAGSGTEGLNGYLTPDSNVPAHYSYLPPQRVPFDTRAASACSGEGCSVTQRVGGPSPSEITGSVKKGNGGFLVSGFNRFTLAPIEHKTFETALFGLREPEEEHPQGPGQKALEAMKGFLAELAKKEAIVLVTSIHGQGQNPNTLYTFGTTSWKSLGLELAAFGGTKEELIDGGTTPGGDYTLIGVAGLAEGTAPEASTPGARLRGFLVPDDDSIYRPQSVSAVGAPNEKLMSIVLQRPGTEAWPDEGNEEVMKAMSFIGTETKLLGSRPRFAYWNNLTTLAAATEALNEVKEKGRFEAGQGFSGAAFEKAKRDLLVELPLVKSVRLYMEELAQPAGSGANAWEKAATIGAELKDLLNKLQEKSKAQAEYLSFLAELLEIGAIFAGGGPEEETLQKFIEAAAIAAEAGQTLWNTNYDGSETKPSIEVEADRLGEELVRQAKANEKSFTRFGDIVVSDWSKLRVMGTYGGCNQGGSCGKQNEYIELAYEPKMAALAEKNTTEAFERELYSRLVPLAFPIWNTGESEHESNNVKALFYCRDISYPFEEAPELAYFRSPSNFLPGGWRHPETGNSVWNVYLSVARSRRTYGYPSPTMLGRMFNPLVAGKESEEGLQMNRGDFFREGEKINKYVPSPYCYWEE